MSEPDYVVIRAAPDLPAGFLPPHLDGRWYDRATVPVNWGDPDEQDERRRVRGLTVSSAVAVPTGRFEVRDDGAVAEVWEMRP